MLTSRSARSSRSRSRLVRSRMTLLLGASGAVVSMCNWGLANHKDVQTDCSVNATFKGKTYCFSSKDAKSQFMKDPGGNLTKAEFFYKSEHKG